VALRSIRYSSTNRRCFGFNALLSPPVVAASQPQIAKPAAALAGRVCHPHFLIVSLGTTNSVTQATHGLGKFAAARVGSPIEALLSERLIVGTERITPALRSAASVSSSCFDWFVFDPKRNYRLVQINAPQAVDLGTFL
jgi:hypothetical protein